MITREMIIEELRSRGYNAVENDVYKNGDVKLEAIIIRAEERITPTIYVSSIVANSATVKEAADIAEQIYQQHRVTTFDIDSLTNPDYIREHVRIGIEKAGASNADLSRDCEIDDLVQYMYLAAHDPRMGHYSVRITPSLLAAAQLDDDELWELAMQNTENNIRIESMSAVIADIVNEELQDELDDLMPPLYVISNRERFKGAAGILNRRVLEHFAAEHNVKKLVILPSSVHECILVPCHDEDVHIADFDDMVRSVNAEQVADDEQLLNRALIVNF